MFLKDISGYYLVFFVSILIAESSGFCAYVKSMALGSNPKYSDEFDYFEYTDPNAEVGGELRMHLWAPLLLTHFRSGNRCCRAGSIFEPLAIFSLDEPMTMYGLLAEEMELGRDKLSISFRLNREAKFSNGDPVLAKDVVFSYETLISGDGVNPFFKNYWADIKGVSIVSDREVKFTLEKK